MSHELIGIILQALWETLYMVFTAGTLSVLFGLPLGVALLATQENQIFSCPRFHRMLSTVVNIFRSLPFIILLVALIPVTRFVVGTSIGTTAAIVPLTIGAIPFVGRIIENALSEVSPGLIEAGYAMGASPFQIVTKILIPEALPAIVNGITITLITLVGYSAMAGAVGGGGLGDLAIRYGYQRFEMDVMIITVIVLVVVVQLLQSVGYYLARKLTHL